VIILKLLLLFLGLSAALYLLGRFLHGALYTEIPGDLYWRAPVAAGVICVAGPVLASLLNSEETTHWPISFNQLFLFPSARTDLEFKAFEVPSEKGRRFERRTAADGRVQYRDAQGLLPSTPPVLIGITGDNEKVKFEIKKDADGYIDRSQGVRYVDPEGREMTEEQFGSIVSTSYGPLFFNLFVMLLSVGLWFACWWLLLQFGWPQALIFALVSFLVWAVTLNFAW
jgi:hypothetical protein